MRQQILYYAVKYHGEYQTMKKAIEKNEPWEKIEYEGHYLTLLDENYPKCLFQLEEPPFILFYEGNLDLLNQRCVCVIGSRNISNHAYKSIASLMRNINPKEVIVSGLAKGIDALAHQEAIRSHRKTIGVIGCGLDICYPKQNEVLYVTMKKDHLVLSEYPKGTKPFSHHFPLRNRILAALSDRCYVVEAKRKSGTMITANYAFSLNKEVIAFPHRYDDVFGEGCNELIQLGASVFIAER